MRIKETLKLTGWYALGATAIGVSKVYKAGKYIASELNQGTPQEFVRYTNKDIASRFKSKQPQDQPQSV